MSTVTRGAALGPVRITWSAANAEIDAGLDPEASGVSGTLRRLGPSQLRRYQSLDATRGRRFATGRLLLATLVPELMSTVSVRLTSVCDQCGGDHGRPLIEGAPFAVSVSYAGDMVIAAAVALDSASAVGIDIERDPSTDYPSTERPRTIDAPLSELTRLFAPRIPPGLREWTEIEAAVKADGRGLRIPPADVTFDAHSTMLPGGRTVRVPGRRELFEVAAAPGPTGHIVSVAVAPPTPQAPQTP